MNPPLLPRVTLVTSNGVGLGHLSRESAIAIAIGDRADVTMFTFSRGFPLVSQFGIRGEFCPSHSSPWIPREHWDKYVERRFEVFLSEIAPDIVLFDGVAPYNGVINALRNAPSISAGWLRRGMWVRGPTTGQLAKSTLFDFVIEPGELASEADSGPTATLESIRVPPVSLFEVVPTLGRQEAAAALGLDPEQPTLLFALGSGQPGNAASARRAALDTALQHHDWQVAVVRSPLDQPESDEDPAAEGVQLNGIYPLVRYRAAFDAAVSGAGYNSVHELIPAGVPTLLVPNPAARTDNQAARAAYLAEHELALVAADDDIHAVEGGVDDLLGDARAGLVENLRALRAEDAVGGAAAVAAILTSDPPIGVRNTGTDDWRQPGARGLVKRMLRRISPRPARITVSLDRRDGLTHLLVSDDPADVALSDRQPVEHVMEGTTSSYRRARRELIDEFYEVAT